MKEEQEQITKMTNPDTGDDISHGAVVRREIRNNGQTEVVCVDQPGPGGVCHEYLISQAEGPLSFFLVMFQKGPITCDEDVNGCQIEDLIAICIDRLEGFRNGPFSCDENEEAIFCLESTLVWLEDRTADHETRGLKLIKNKEMRQ